MNEPTLRYLSEQHPQLIDLLNRIEPLAAAIRFGSLLLLPGYQKHCLRFETLVHLSLLHGAGEIPPTDAQVLQAIEELDKGWCGQAEDPPEDLPLTLVNNSTGNFRVLQGIWQGTGFHLQRILNVVDTMPRSASFKELKRSIEALLRLSESVAEKVSLSEFTPGSEEPHEHLAKDLCVIGSHLEFSKTDLQQLGVSSDALQEFVNESGIDPGERLGNTDLERRPLIVRDDTIVLVLPTAVFPAIARFVIESMGQINKLDTFAGTLALDHVEALSRTSWHGVVDLPLDSPSRRSSTVAIAGGVIEIEPGNYLAAIGVFDRLRDFHIHGLSGFSGDEKDSEDVEHQIRLVTEAASVRPGFKDGLILVIHCGIGRGVHLAFSSTWSSDWQLRTVTSYDMETLGSIDTFDIYSLWNVIRLEEAMSAHKVSVLNASGLLNFVSWARQTNGSLTAYDDQLHAHRRGLDLIVIPQNALKEQRLEAALARRHRRVLTPEGEWIRAGAFERGHELSSELGPMFIAEDDVAKGRLKAVYLGSCSWWIELDASPADPRPWLYRHWEMLTTWLPRVARAIEITTPGFPHEFVYYVVSFEHLDDAEIQDNPTSGDINSITQAIRVVRDRSRVRITVGSHFQLGLRHASNVAERALVQTLVEAALGLHEGMCKPSAVAEVMNLVCPNNEARQLHVYVSKSYRDRSSANSKWKPILLDPVLQGACQLGLGWQAHPDSEESSIEGVSECRAVLNRAVSVLLEQVCLELKRFNRRSMISALTNNHEAAEIERNRWRTTARSKTAFQGDETVGVRDIARKINELGLSSFASRILMEATLSESPIDGGFVPSRIDLPPLLTKAFLAFAYGGWSDAVHREAMKPMIGLSPLGEIQMDLSFVDAVYQPFAQDESERLVTKSMRRFAELYEEPDVVESVEGLLPADFIAAWTAEFGVHIDTFRRVLDALENLGIEREAHFLIIRHSELRTIFVEGNANTEGGVDRAMAKVVSQPRSGWRTAPPGYRNSDWAPWRLRRRLSVLRRPFLQLEDDLDPEILVAPGILRDALRVLVQSHHDGEVPSGEPDARSMRAWIGKQNGESRVKFNVRVKSRFEELGWKARSDANVTDILAAGKDPQFGDLKLFGDVDVLAWDLSSGRVFAVECKELQTRRTMGEVAAQLAEFRGKDRSDGTPDRLKRHIRRVDVLRANSEKLTKMLKLNAPCQIEGHIVFSDPVALKYAWDSKALDVELSLFEELDRFAI